jgi:hypothetical protein
MRGTHLPDEARLDALQLELLSLDEGREHDRGISRSLARASVPPGWWPLIAGLYGRFLDLRVDVCREVDGELQLHVSAKDDGGDLALLGPVVQEIQAKAAGTCGCCGGVPAARCRTSLTDPAHVLCASCGQRVRGGETVLGVADEYWCLDGSRRVAPRVRNSVSRAGQASTDAPRGRECTALPPAELRTLIVELRRRLTEEIVGQEAVARLALLAGMHVGGGLPRGSRALLIGPSGVGKSTSIEVLRRILGDLGWSLPLVVTDAVELTAPAYSGAPSIGDLLEAAIGNNAPDSWYARHAIVAIDEPHHVAVKPGEYPGTHAIYHRERFASWLPLIGYGTLRLGDGDREWSSLNALVLCCGVFPALPHNSVTSVRELVVHGGLPLELASRFEEVIRYRPLEEAALRQLLRRWPALVALTAVCERLGIEVTIDDVVFSRAARAVRIGHDGSTPRTAGSWIVAALRDAMVKALADPAIREIVITPDSLSISPTATRREPPEEPPESSGPWDGRPGLTPR